MHLADNKREMQSPGSGYVSYLQHNHQMDLRWLLSSSGDTDPMEVSESTYHALEHLADVYDHIEFNLTFEQVDDDDNHENITYPMALTYDCSEYEHFAEDAKHLESAFEDFYDDCHDADHDHTAFGIYLILYAAFVLFLGCVFKWAQSRWKIPVPYTVLLLLLGIILQTWESLESDHWNDLKYGLGSTAKIDPHMILNLFIPGLIFESAFNTNYHIFQKEREQALLLAGPGVVVNLILLGGAMHYFAWPYDWSWSFCFMFGAIVSATDPVAVVALLKELGASKRLSTLIEAESLLNDGTAFVLFTVFQGYAASPEGTTFAYVIETLLWLAVGGVVCGLVFGFLTYRALLYVFNDFQIEITFSLCMCYLAFYTGENVLKVSGVLTVVFMGLWVSKNRQAVSPLVEETMHHFWEMVGFIANTILFFVTGQVVADRIIASQTEFGWEDFIILLILYIMTHIIRALAMWQLFPALESIGYGCTWKDAIVMVYGGLRGAIGLALALIVDLEDKFPQDDRDRVLLHVSGIVVLTLVVNATTVGWIVGKLGLNKPPKDTAALFKSATDFLEDHIHHHMSQMKLDKHYHGANWTKVDELQPQYEELVNDIFGALDEDERQEVLALTGDASNDGSEGHEPVQTTQRKGDISSPLVVDMLIALGEAQKEAGERREIEKRLIQVMKSSYWSQYEKGLISSDAVHVLVEAAESAMDDHNLEIQYKVLKKFFTIPRYVQKMHTAKICGSFGTQLMKGIAERLLFSNLGFAVELASGFIYASKQARDFSQMLIKNAGVKTEMVESTITQLDVATQFVAKNLSSVEKVYPEVHQAIQTSHAAHALLHHQKHEIEALLHQGVFDEAECDRVMELCDEALNKLFHTGYSEYIKDLNDVNTLLNAPLFSELTDLEKQLVRQKAVQSEWYDKGNAIIQAGKRSKGLFVITRGTVDVFEVIDQADRKRTLSEYEGPIKSFGAPLYGKQRGECIDIWPLLEERKHNHTFIVTSDKCHGFWLNFELLHLLKESNIDFWDTLWKIAAVDVIRYYYQDSKIFDNFDFNNVESIVFNSPLSYYDGDHDEMRQIRVARGFGILLNGTIVKISDASNTADAPAILTSMAAQDYVAVNECVVLTLDVNRNKLTSMESNAKLAKLFGLKAKNRNKAKPEDTILESDEESSLSRTYSSSFSLSGAHDDSDNDVQQNEQKTQDDDPHRRDALQPQERVLKGQSKDNVMIKDAEGEIEVQRMGTTTEVIVQTSAHDVGAVAVAAGAGARAVSEDDADKKNSEFEPLKSTSATTHVGANVVEEDDNTPTVGVVTTLSSGGPTASSGAAAAAAGAGVKGSRPASSHANRKGSKKRQQQGVRMAYDMGLDESKLPELIRNEWNKWSDDECWNVLKHVLYKHEHMFEQLRHFQINHITSEVQSKKLSKKVKHRRENKDKGAGADKSEKTDKGYDTDRKDMELSDSEEIDTPETSVGVGGSSAAKSKASRVGSYMALAGTGSGGKRAKGSKWARPSMGPNAIRKAQTIIQQGVQQGSESGGIKTKTSLLGKNSFRSSRFLNSQALQSDGRAGGRAGRGGSPVSDAYQSVAGYASEVGVITSKRFKKQRKLLNKQKSVEAAKKKEEAHDAALIDDALSGMKAHKSKRQQSKVNTTADSGNGTSTAAAAASGNNGDGNETDTQNNNNVNSSGNDAGAVSDGEELGWVATEHGDAPDIKDL